MLIDTKALSNGLTSISVSGALQRASALHDLSEAMGRLNNKGKRGVLLDFGKLTRMNMAGLAALVELVSRHPKTDLALCALPDKQLAFLRKSGLDRGLFIFPSIKEACADPMFQAHSLSGTRTVLLCAEKGKRMAPLSQTFPTPLLDMAGRPVVQRILDHLSSFGLRDVLLNPGHLGPQIVEYFRKTPLPDTQITFANEGRWKNGTWYEHPLGSAATLKTMQERSAAFATDIVVLSSDALTDLDFSDMMQDHRETGADMTMATHHIPTNAVCGATPLDAGTGQNILRLTEKLRAEPPHTRCVHAGIYILKPDVLSLLETHEGLDIAQDLVPKVMSSGGKVHIYDKPFVHTDIRCARDYAAALTQCLTGHLGTIFSTGREVRPGLWVMPGAEISPKARITGPCHIGAGARIEAGAHLDGVCSIGSNAVVQGGTVLQNSIVMPETRVSFGAWADHMILSGEWAVDHRRTDVHAHDHTPLEHVSFSRPASADPHMQWRNQAS